MALPSLLAENFFRFANVVLTDPGAATGFAASRMRDSKDFLQWKSDAAATKVYKVDLGDGTAGTPGAIEATAVAVVNHNLGSEGCDFTVEHSDNDVAWTPVFTDSPVDDDRIIYRIFDSEGSHRYWRVRFINATTDTQVGEVYLGRRIDFPYANVWNGFDPMLEVPVARATRNVQGRITGTVVEAIDRIIEVTFPLLPFSSSGSTVREFLAERNANSFDVLSKFLSWWENAGRMMYPFVFAWNANDASTPGTTSLFEDDALWCVADPESEIVRPLATPLDGGYRDLTLRMIGLADPGGGLEDSLT